MYDLIPPIQVGNSPRRRSRCSSSRASTVGDFAVYSVCDIIGRRDLTDFDVGRPLGVLAYQPPARNPSLRVRNTRTNRGGLIPMSVSCVTELLGETSAPGDENKRGPLKQVTGDLALRGGTSQRGSHSEKPLYSECISDTRAKQPLADLNIVGSSAK